jgi:hypothetical protein
MRHLIIPYKPEESLKRQKKRQRRTNTRKRKVKKKAKQVKNKSTYNMDLYFFKNNTSYMGTAVAHWSRYCATNRKVVGLIPDGVIGIFH